MSLVAERIRQRIREQGPMTFGHFMQEALYGEEGYYARSDLPIGRAGDFVTGSSYSPLFGQATARLLRRLDRLFGQPADFFEAGYGDGTHLSAVIEALGETRDRRIWAWDQSPRSVPEPARAIENLEAIGEGEVQGLVFSYELFDALPVHRLVGRPGGLGELWVALSDSGEFRFEEGEVSDPRLTSLLGDAATQLEPGQIVDLAPGWQPLYRRLADRLGRGLLVTFDYGFERKRLLDPRVRLHGTLACYRNHRVHRNPFEEVGHQDLTAHVDFSALRAEGEAAGLETLAFTRQARWLGACDIFEDLATAPQVQRLEAATLLDPGGMGEEIRVLVQGRHCEGEKLFDLKLLVSG